jgi:hypothetical protein
MLTPGQPAVAHSLGISFRSTYNLPDFDLEAARSQSPRRQR